MSTTWTDIPDDVKSGVSRESPAIISFRMRELEMLRGRGCVRLLCSLSRAVLPYARGRFNNAVVDLEKCSVSPVEFRGLLAGTR